MQTTFEKFCYEIYC